MCADKWVVCGERQAWESCVKWCVMSKMCLVSGGTVCKDSGISVVVERCYILEDRCGMNNTYGG